MSGYVRIHRSLIEHPAFRNDAESMAFAWMIAKAAWASRRVRYKERCIHLARGQLAVSQRDMARALDRDKAWVERLWKRLKNEAMIEASSEAGVAVITICNYGEYQADPILCEAPSKAGARQGQGTEQEGEEREEKKLPRQRGLVVPDFVPDEEYAAFRKMRKAMKVPFTEEAEKGTFEDLKRLLVDGHDLKKVLMKAVKRGWRGVFGDEDTKADRAALSIDEQIAQLERAIPRYLSDGRQDYVEQAEAQIAELRGKPPDPATAANVNRIVKSAGSMMGRA